MNTEILDVRGAAAHLCVSIPTLNRWRITGEGPVFVKMGGAVRYAKADLDAFISASRRNHTSTAPRSLRLGAGA